MPRYGDHRSSGDDDAQGVAGDRVGRRRPQTPKGRARPLEEDEPGPLATSSADVASARPAGQGSAGREIRLRSDAVVDEVASGRGGDTGELDHVADDVVVGAVGEDVGV